MKKHETKQSMSTRDDDFVMGVHASEATLQSDHDINRMYLQKGLTDDRIMRLERQAKKQKIPVQWVPKQKLDQLTDQGNHQGIVLAVSPYPYRTLDDIFQVAEERHEDPFILILDGIKDPHNLGSILRTADVTGVHGIIIPNRRAVGLTSTVAKTSTGAIEYVPVVRVTNISHTIEQLKERGVWIFGTDMDGQTFWEMDATLPIALVIGDEGSGISQGVKKHLDGMLTIPMHGHMQSLNASVAAGLMMYEVFHKRLEQ
ncbi:MAG: 23S rRNA (guanosine(2251)-2'-O)-methyltransferase RlmB [Aerococcus sp.]|nr:23S rRNA (guanosine(2251)-2'-O)-methyltransferase RlmB [Aerococcus sp.]